MDCGIYRVAQAPWQAGVGLSHIGTSHETNRFHYLWVPYHLNNVQEMSEGDVMQS